MYIYKCNILKKGGEFISKDSNNYIDIHFFYFSQEEATKVTTDPEQMVQLIQIEQGPFEAELQPQLFNSNVNQFLILSYRKK